MKTKFISIVVIAILFVGGLGIFMNKTQTGPNKLDGFAQCLKTNGAEFYGTFWCPSCQDQKKLFGSSAKYLPYIECSTPNGTGQKQICKDKKIEGYPLWIFADGTRASGLQSLLQLSEKTQCLLPQ